jgi:hypothetical protein
MDIIIEGINVSKQLRDIKEYIADKSYEDALADTDGFFHNISYATIKPILLINA